jgi:cation transport ATPase
VVVAGHSDIDQSPVTGESLPVEKQVDDEVSPELSTARACFDVRATRRRMRARRRVSPALCSKRRSKNRSASAPSKRSR